MNFVLTDNFYRALANMMFGNVTDLGQYATNTKQEGACKAFQPLKSTDNTVCERMYWGSTDNDKFMSFGAVSNAVTNSYSQLRFDIGYNTDESKSEAKRSDIKLTDLQGATYTTLTEIKRIVEYGNPKVRYTVTVKNTGSGDLVFNEIGMLKSFIINASSTRKDFLMGRACFEDKTIAPNEQKVFDFDIEIPS